MVVAGPSFNGQNFSRCSYSSVHFGDEYDCKRCGRCRKKCMSIFKGRFKRVAILTLKVVIVINLLFFIGIPLFFKYSYYLQQKALFLNFGPISLKVAALLNLNLPKNNDYSDPKLYGLEGARNFYLEKDDIRLGVWQILPSQLTSNNTDDSFFETALSNGQDVILYNHGNAGSRATAHRVELYKLLSNFFHVIAYDYRGYGDSTNEPPTEKGVVSDCVFMIEWIRSKMSQDAHIFIWGHSLGTSVTLAAVSALKKKGLVPSGVILEAPFNNLRDEIGEHPLTLVFRYLPWFENCMVDPLGENGFLFESDRYIMSVDCPILILHAEDDRTVPYKLGKRLYENTIGNRLESQGSIKLITFPKKFHYGHKYIIKAPELHDIIQKFVKDAINETTNMLQLEKEM